MISFYDVWKKRNKINGGSESESRVANSKSIHNNMFANDPSYKKATVQKPNLQIEDLEIRVINIDSKPAEKEFTLRPNEFVDVGSYISYKDSQNSTVTYLVGNYEENYISPVLKVEKCNQVIKISEDFIVPCIAKGSSYGVKLNLTSGSILSDSDTKIDVEVGVNEMTKKIKLDTRFILNGEQEGIYKIMDKKVFENGKYVFTCQKDNYMKGLDDLESSIAYNGDKLPAVDMDYTIHGSDRIVINKEYTYDITPKDGVIEFSFDEDTISDSLAVIVSRTEYTVTVKALVSDTVITLNVIHNGVVSGTKNITTAKR